MIVSSLALSAQSGGTIEINDYDRHLRDLRLDLNKTNIINSNHFGEATSYTSGGNYMSSTNSIGVTIDQSYFLTSGSHHIIVKYSGTGSYVDRNLISRLELVYYSY